MSERVLAAEPAFRDEDGQPSSETVVWLGADFPGQPGEFDDGDEQGFIDTVGF